MADEVASSHDDDDIIEVDAVARAACPWCLGYRCPECNWCPDCDGHAPGCSRKMATPPFFSGPLRKP